MTRQPGARMSAPERRAGIIDAAVTVFALRGWGAATTAMISRGAQVNEALLFRHFGSKQVLYLAAIDSAWQHVRELADSARPAEPEVDAWRLPGRAFLELARTRPAAAQLWARALAEQTGVVDIDEHLNHRIREIHSWVIGYLAVSQSAGGIPRDRKLGAEAWLIISLGWLGVTTARLGSEASAEYDDVLVTHRERLTGAA